MAIADAVEIPRNMIYKGKLIHMLNSLDGVEITDIGDKGIMVILKYNDFLGLSDLAELVSGWDDVIDFQLTGLYQPTTGNKNRVKSRRQIRHAH